MCVCVCMSVCVCVYVWCCVCMCVSVMRDVCDVGWWGVCDVLFVMSVMSVMRDEVCDGECNVWCVMRYAVWFLPCKLRYNVRDMMCNVMQSARGCVCYEFSTMYGRPVFIANNDNLKGCYVCIHVCLYVSRSVFTNVPVYMYACRYVRMYVCMCVRRTLRLICRPLDEEWRQFHLSSKGEPI